MRKVLPAGIDTNGRAYFIFFSYMLLAFSVTVFIIQRLVKSYAVLSKSTTARAPPKEHVRYFTFLAGASLATTWYYMYRYFQFSYRIWLMWRSIYEVDPAKHHWGLWLKETSLFREAWEIAITGFGRYWWTQQIFFFACGLGLILEQKGVRRGIKHTWAFMLLGQIVAISFATNLFFLAVLLSPPPPPAPSSTRVHQSKPLGPWLINLVTVIVTVVSAYLLGTQKYWHAPEFLTILLIPHVVLLVLPLARIFPSSKNILGDSAQPAKGNYTYLWAITIVGWALLTLKTTIATYNYNGFEGIWLALDENAAVSSVGWDVIFCWISWVVWLNTQKPGSGSLHVDETPDKENEWVGAGFGTSIAGGNVGGSEVRRR